MVIRRKQKKASWWLISILVSVSASHAVCRGFASRLGHTKDHYKIGKNAVLLGTHALGKEFDSVARLSKSRIVYGTAFMDMPFKDLLRSIARVEYRIPVPDFYLVLHCLWCRNKHFNGLINQSSRIEKPSKCILGMEILCNNNLFENKKVREGRFILKHSYISMIGWPVKFHW